MSFITVNLLLMSSRFPRRCSNPHPWWSPVNGSFNLFYGRSTARFTARWNVPCMKSKKDAPKLECRLSSQASAVTYLADLRRRSGPRPRCSIRGSETVRGKMGSERAHGELSVLIVQRSLLQRVYVYSTRRRSLASSCTNAELGKLNAVRAPHRVALEHSTYYAWGNTMATRGGSLSDSIP